MTWHLNGHLFHVALYLNLKGRPPAWHLECFSTFAEELGHEPDHYTKKGCKNARKILTRQEENYTVENGKLYKDSEQVC